MNDSARSEPILEPDLPIVDPHHHLWVRSTEFLDAIEQQENAMARALLPAFRRRARYLLDEFLADVRTGHNVRATVFIEVHAMYRTRGPEALRSVGEVEFANGMAAMSASGEFGDTTVCAGIVGNVDLRLGEAVRDVLLAHMQAGGGRYRGVRPPGVAYDSDSQALGALSGQPHLMLDPQFRAGFKQLEPLGLSYEAWQLEYQLPELIDLARAFPHTQIIVDHLGGLFGIGRHANRRDERFAAWRDNIRVLSRCENVAMKLGGLGMPTTGLPTAAAPTSPSSLELANDWRPYIETCIESFGPDRCMFESNYPVDAATASYAVIWNAFKRLVEGASREEKLALFGGTAQRIYRLEL